MSLLIGDIVHGYVEGYFGRDHYDCARIEAFGVDWVVIRNIGWGPDGGLVATGSGQGILEACERARNVGPDYAAHTCGIENP